MTRSELIDHLAIRFPQLTISDTEASVSVILAAISQSLASGERTEIRGQKSKESLSELCFQKTASANVLDRDRNKRFVARVNCSGIDANLEQVRRGMAWRYVKYSKDLLIAEAETQAREQGRGLWKDPEPVAPWVWRKLKRSQSATSK